MLNYSENAEAVVPDRKPEMASQLDPAAGSFAARQMEDPPREGGTDHL